VKGGDRKRGKPRIIFSACLTWLMRMSPTEVWGVHFGVNNNERRVFSFRHRVRIKNSLFPFVPIVNTFSHAMKRIIYHSQVSSIRVHERGNRLSTRLDCQVYTEAGLFLQEPS
jgi:hypothetical protein